MLFPWHCGNPLVNLLAEGHVPGEPRWEEEEEEEFQVDEAAAPPLLLTQMRLLSSTELKK